MDTVKEIAATDVVTAARADSVSDVAELMREENVGSVVVEEKELSVGIITDRQLALALADDPEIGHENVAKLMTFDVATVPESASVFQTVQLMSDEGIRRAPVVDDDDRLVGLVSLDDILHVIAEEFNTAEDIIKAQSPRF